MLILWQKGRVICFGKNSQPWFHLLSGFTVLVNLLSKGHFCLVRCSLLGYGVSGKVSSSLVDDGLDIGICWWDWCDAWLHHRYSKISKLSNVGSITFTTYSIKLYTKTSLCFRALQRNKFSTNIIRHIFFYVSTCSLYVNFVCTFLLSSVERTLYFVCWWWKPKTRSQILKKFCTSVFVLYLVPAVIVISYYFHSHGVPQY